MKPTIKNSIANSLTYSEYKATVTELFKKGLVTGRDQTEARIHSTELNEARVRRLDKNRYPITIINYNSIEGNRTFNIQEMGNRISI